MAKKKVGFRRPVLGDIVEVPLSNGMAYVQYVNRHRAPPVFGDLIRVLPGTFQKRPESFSALVREPERFMAFFPLNTAVRRELIEIVGHEDIPESCREFPVFKGCNVQFETGKKTWFLSRFLPDGKIEVTQVGDLPDDCRDLPMKQVITFPVLVERIESGWSPADEV